MKRSIWFGSIALALATNVYGQQVIGNCSILPPDNIWNTPVDTLPVLSNSSSMVNTIGANTGLHPDFGAGILDGGTIGIPFVVVPGTQTRYPIAFGAFGDESDPGPYAIPLNAPIESGGDGHAIAVDTDNCILYELYHAVAQSSSWTADAGAIFDLKSNALRTAGWTSADAAGLPIMPGLVTYEEVQSGEIRHAIRFTAPQTRNAYVWPARHIASSLTGTQYPRMGERLRLKAAFDVTPFPPEVQVILRAMKKYGIILADNGSAWFISGKPDDRWNNDNLHMLGHVLGSDFEAVDATVLEIDPDSGAAIQNGVSVNVTPGSASVRVNHSQAFTATVNGATNTVTWDVNGIDGGDPIVGTIDSNGVYTAPSVVPSPAGVTVRATSTVSPASSGTASVTIAPPTTLTSVTPSSFPAGSFTIALTGTGFIPGAVVSFDGAALATTFASATGLTATGNAPVAKTAVPVFVSGPDGDLSNTLFVDVTAPPPVSITISPTGATVRVKRSQQFTATVQNTSNTAVIWKVNGITGGNSTIGTISTSGLYKAPGSVPNPAVVSVSATSAADPTKTASAAVTISRR